MNGRLSRRTFLAGMGGSAVAAVAVWELAGLGFRSRRDVGVAPIPGVPEHLTEHLAEHDGWLVTVPDKRLLEFPVRYLEGWYSEEGDSGVTWRWSRKAGSILAPNLGVEAMMYVDYDGRADVFRDRPRTITVSAGDRVIETFVDDAPGRQRRGVALPAGVSGQGQVLELTLATDHAFVPAQHLAGSRDRRELGLQVYEVEIREAGIQR
jgi:hypothetical protein